MAKLTDEERAELKARLDQKWWDKWWAQDFSWSGLKNHPWQGWSITPDGQVMESEDPALPDESRDATLQDYWRWDGRSLRSDDALLAAGLLEDHEGQPRFHICHLPERWKDGSDSWKERPSHPRWVDIERELAHRVNTAAKTEAEKTTSWQGEKLIGPDRRAQLTGAQIRALPRPPAPDPSQDENQAEAGAYHLRADYTRWLEDTNFGQAVFGSPTRFDNAQFSGGDAYFKFAQFSGGRADFDETQFSGGDANFLSAQFSGGRADFDETQFSGGNAHFFQAQFSGGNAYFLEAQFSGGNADFYNAQFSGGDAYFRHAQFSGGNAVFIQAQFSGGDAIFQDAQFSGGNASFINAQFSGGDANFNQAQVSGGNADFSFVQFSGGNADFQGAQFSGGYAVFQNTRFHKTAFFGGDNAALPDSNAAAPGFYHRLSFRSAEFQDTAEFRHCHFPARAEDRQSAFAGARFKEAVDFTTLGRLPLEAFDGAILEKRLLLHSDTPREDAFRQACREIRTAVREDRAFRPARGLRRAWHSLPFTPDLPEPKEDTQRGQRGPGPRWAALEGGCRTLKRAMADAEDIHREQQFFRMALIARRHRPTRFMFWNRESSVGVFETITSHLYGLMGDYGASIFRPVISFMAVCLLFAALYTGWMHGAGGDPLSACDAPTRIDALAGPLEFSFKQGFRPFFIWASSVHSPCWTESFETAVGPLGWVGVRLVATAQSILSIALLFLTGLALRRKFQIG